MLCGMQKGSHRDFAGAIESCSRMMICARGLHREEKTAVIRQDLLLCLPGSIHGISMVCCMLGCTGPRTVASAFPAFATSRSHAYVTWEISSRAYKRQERSWVQSALPLFYF